MAANWQDVHVFEALHRLFCRRLADAGLMDHSDVRQELGQGWVCSEVDTSNPEAYCALLLSPRVRKASDADRELCADRKRCGTTGCKAGRANAANR